MLPKILAEHPTLTVPGQRIMVVGESPTDKDEIARRPFTGPPGDLLNSHLSRNGILRSQCWLTNVCKYRPPGGKLGSWFSGATNNPQYWRITEGVNELWDEIKSYNPTIILALGNFALWALTGLGGPSKESGWAGITKYRGSLLPSIAVQVVGGIRQYKVLPTYHPQFVHRQWKWNPVFGLDIQKLKANSYDTPLIEPPINIRLLEGPEQIATELSRLPANEPVASDIECNKDRLITVISFAASPTEALVIPFKGKSGYLYQPHTEGQIWRTIQSTYNRLTSHGGQNFMFDRLILAAKYRVYVPRLAFDNLIASKIAVPEFPAGLDFQTSVWTNRPYYKDDGKDWADPSNWDNFYRYSGLDSAVTLEARAKLAKELTDTGNTRIFEMALLLQDALFAANLRGLHFDTARAIQHQSNINKSLQILEQILFGVLEAEFNPASEQQVKKILYNYLGYKPKKSRAKTSKSGITSDNLAIMKCDIEKPDPILDYLLAWKKLSKKLSFVRAKPHSPTDGPLAGKITYFLQSSTETGRLACKGSPLLTRYKSDNPDDDSSSLNMQTIPHDLRDMFIPPPGRVFVYSDGSQAEARRVAWLADDHKMQDLFITGKDIHKFNASLCFKKPESEVTSLERHAGKKVVHGRNYRMGFQTMQDSLLKEGFRLTLQECRNAGTAYTDANPRIEYLHQEISRALSTEQPLENAFGRRRRFFGRFNDEQTLKEAIAFLPQSEVADLISISIIAIEFGTGELIKMGLWNGPELPPLWPDVQIHLQVHDAILWSCEPAQLDHLIPEVTKRMEIPITTKGRTHTIPITHHSSALNWALCE